MNKQTAVEFLVSKIWKTEPLEHEQKVIDQAKAMEKQQSITDYCEGFKASGEGWNGEYGLTDMLDVAGEINAEQYYNEMYADKEIEEIKSEFVCKMEDCPHCAYEYQQKYEAELEEDAAIDFGEWLLKECGEFTTIPMTELYELYLKDTL